MSFQPAEGAKLLAHPPFSAAPEDSAHGRILLLLALLLTALAYLTTLRFAFTYDDTPQIVLNSSLIYWSTLPTFFTSHSWKFLFPDWAGNYYRPIFMTWLLVNRKIFDLYTPAWHATSLLVHLVVTWLSFVVARRLLRNSTHAGFAAILFGLHPIHVEAVAWVSGITDPLMSAFVLASFWAWLKAEDSPDRGLLYKVLAAIFFLAGCLSKETALLFPVVVVAYELLWDRRERSFAGLLRAAVYVLPLWVAVVVYLVARTLALHGLEHSSQRATQALLTVPTIFWGYMRRLVWPVHTSIFYSTPPVTSVLQVRFWLPFVALIVAAVFGWRVGKRSRIAGFSIVWILAFLAPALIGLPVFNAGEWIHDRYLYLPSFGFCLLLAALLAQIPSRRELFGLPAASTAIVLLLAAGMALGTTIEEIPWSNDFTLFLHATLLQPQSAQAQSHLATEFYRRGDIADAELRYQKSLQLEPNNWKNRLAYALMLYYSGQFAKSDRELQEAIAIQPNDSNEYFYLGMDRFNLGQYQAAEKAFAQAITKGPTRTRYHFWLGFALERQGRLAEAKAQYQMELSQHPDTDTQARARLDAIEPR